MGKRDYAALKQGFGLSRGLSEEFVRICEAKDVPIEAIHRLVTPKGSKTMEILAERILADWQDEQPKTIEMPEPIDDDPCRYAPTDGNAPFSAPIVHQPEIEELRRRFPAFVNPDYKGTRFDPIERCTDVSRENREVAFEYVHMNRVASTGGVLAEMDRKGLRPALYEELLGFALKYPDEQRKHPIVALGSETDVGVRRYVAVLSCSDRGRSLGLVWIAPDLDGHFRFLAVRK